MCNYQKREAAVLFKGLPVTLIGPEIRVGDNAPDCMVVDNNLSWCQKLPPNRTTLPHLLS